MVRDASPLFLTSGDLLADRRYDHAMALRGRGELAEAADLMEQALDLAPRFASAWFALGEMRAELGERDGACLAFEKALAADPEDHHGAALHLARLGGENPATRELHTYVRTLFDQYAPRFDRALEDLGYCAPALLRDAVLTEGRYFERMLDLGCGTGLAGEAFRPFVGRLAGVDLSAKMIEAARAKGHYDQLDVGEIAAFLAAQCESGVAFDLIIAADVFAYVADLEMVCDLVARVLGPGGLFAFTVETHAGEGAIVGPKMRYQHSAGFVRDALERAGLLVLRLETVSSRTENRIAVPGLLAVATRSITSGA